MLSCLNGKVLGLAGSHAADSLSVDLDLVSANRVSVVAACSGHPDQRGHVSG